MRKPILLVLFAAASLVACSDPAQSPVGTPDAGEAGADAAADGPTKPYQPVNPKCNDLELPGTSLSATSTSDPVSSGTGGALSSGTYALSSVVAHGASGSSSPFGNAVVLVDTATSEMDWVAMNADGRVTRTTYGFAVRGQSLEATSVCRYPIDGKNDSFTAGFTADPNGFTLFVPAGAVTLEERFDRRP
jgi:hypothetical protein